MSPCDKDAVAITHMVEDQPGEQQDKKQQGAIFDKAELLSVFEQFDVKLSPQTYLKELTSRFKLTRTQAKKILKRLIDDQELCYQYEYGTTYIEKSFLKPVRVSPHFILTPPHFFNTKESSSDIRICIEQGISFGSGQHPTTRLCLQAIDHCLFELGLFKGQKQLSAADIGTGSGVLAIALCKAGIAFCQAYEIDPVSANEAEKNINHNDLKNQIQIQKSLIQEQKNRFSVICANLRFPSLSTLSGLIYNSLTDEGVAIFSGVREWEKSQMTAHFETQGFELLWQADHKKWSAFVMGKKLC